MENLHQIHILIVDDDPLSLRFLSTELKHAGFRVEEKTNGERALEYLKTNIPDVILLDVMMPGIDGFETCKKIRGNPAFSETPIIFLTAKSRDKDIEKGFEAGGTDYLVKPFKSLELLARIKRHTDQKSYQEKLIKMQTHLQAVLNTIPSGLFTIDTDKKITSWSPSSEHITGIEAKEAIGKHCHVIFKDPECEKSCPLFSKNSDLPILNIEKECELQDGRKISLLKNYNSLKNNKGEIIGGVVSFNNITEQKNVQIKLINSQKEARARNLELQKALSDALSANKLKDEFISTMSHELRTPLNGILGMTQILSSLETDKEKMDFITIINKSGNQLLKIINDILEHAKIESAKINFQEVSFNLENVLSNIIKFQSNDINDKKLQIDLQINDDVPKRLVGDPQRLTQILNYLIENAIKFTKEGNILIKIQKASPDLLKEKNLFAYLGNVLSPLLFSVADSGIGIVPEKQGKIFDSFFQSDGSFTREYSGIGLGLANCKKLIQLMDGVIWLDSTVGKGSNFQFILGFKEKLSG